MLISSLIGTVVVTFTIVLQTLEEYCHIPTDGSHASSDNLNEPAAIDESTDLSGLTVKGHPSALHSEKFEHLERENERLKNMVRLLAQISKATRAGPTAGGDENALFGELDRELAFIASAAVAARDPSLTISIHVGTTADDQHAGPSRLSVTGTDRADHDSQHDESSPRSRRWSKDEGWVGCQLSGVANGAENSVLPLAAAAMVVEMAPVVTTRTRDGHCEDLGANAHLNIDSEMSSALASIDIGTAVDDEMARLPVDDGVSALIMTTACVDSRTDDACSISGSVAKTSTPRQTPTDHDESARDHGHAERLA